VADLWIIGTAIGAGLAVHEARLGRWRVESNTRTTDLPTMVAQTLGAAFAMMEEYEDLWLATESGPPLPVDGSPVLPSDETVQIDVERMVGAFGRGLRDLGTIWEQVLAPETYGDVLSLDIEDLTRFRFRMTCGRGSCTTSRSGITGAWCTATTCCARSCRSIWGARPPSCWRRGSATPAAVESGLDAVAAAFARQKPYLVDRWR
jgi:hypothetical protein